MRRKSSSLANLAVIGLFCCLALSGNAAAQARLDETLWEQVDLTAVPPAAPNVTAAVKRPMRDSPDSFYVNEADKTIRGGIERWARMTGWKLSWELAGSTQGGKIEFAGDFGTDFESALSKLASAMHAVPVQFLLYANNRVLRVVDAGSVSAQSALAQRQQEKSQKSLPHVSHVSGYWLGKSLKRSGEGSAANELDEGVMPAIALSSVVLTYSDRTSLPVLVRTLSNVSGISIVLPGTTNYSAAKLLLDEKVAKTTSSQKFKGTRTYKGTPKDVLDRIARVTGWTWQFEEGTAVFTK